MLRTRYALALLVPLMVACGDSPTETQVQVMPDVIEVISGDAQVDTILETLDNPIEARVLDDAGDPIVGTVVSHRIFPDGCGEPTAVALQTNSEGITRNGWTLGTLARTSMEGADCGMEVVASIDGEPVVHDTAWATALPGVLAENKLSCCTFKGDTQRTVPQEYLVDAEGNPVYWRLEPEAYAHALSTDSTLDDSRTIVADSAGTGGELWVMYSGDSLCHGWVDVSDSEEQIQAAFPGGTC